MDISYFLNLFDTQTVYFITIRSPSEAFLEINSGILSAEPNN